MASRIDITTSRGGRSSQLATNSARRLRPNNSPPGFPASTTPAVVSTKCCPEVMSIVTVSYSKDRSTLSGNPVAGSSRSSPRGGVGRCFVCFSPAVVCLCWSIDSIQSCLLPVKRSSRSMPARYRRTPTGQIKPHRVLSDLLRQAKQIATVIENAFNA